MPVALPLEGRPSLLPLGDPGLSWPEFETFCRAYVSARPEVRRVEAYAKHGEPQDGIDLIAFLHDGRTRTYQCRKRKDFPKAEAEAVIMATTKTANEHEILVSCEAGKAVRDVVHPLAGWDVSDVKDLSLAVRELDREKARNVVEDAFGVPWRRAFLGPQDALVFVDRDRYFRPFERRDALFRHTWDLVGRRQALDALAGAVIDERLRAVVIVGRGGIGKTRLLRALADRLPAQRMLFALDGAEITAAAVDTLPMAGATVVVDDVHRRHLELGPLLDAAARRDEDPLTVVLATRPQRVDELRGLLARAGLASGQVSVLEPLGDLAQADVEALAAQALGSEDIVWAAPLAAATADCPLVTVIGGQLLAERKLRPELFERDEDFRYAVLERWREEIVGQVADDIDPAAVAATLRIVAALAPLSTADAPTLELAAAEAKLSVVELRRVLAALEDAGLLVAYGRLRRIVPDVLADHILHRACLTQRGEPTGYAEELYDRYGATALPALLRSLAELDWRIAATSGATVLLDDVWTRIERSFLARDAAGRVELLDRLLPAAHLQPGRILALAQRALERPGPASPLAAVFDVDLGDNWVREHLPALVARAGSAPEHVQTALSILWQLARTGGRAPVMGGVDAIRAMQDLGDPAGDQRAFEHLVAFVERLLASPEADAPVSPLVLLERATSREGTTLRREGLGFLPLHYGLRSEVVGPLRRRMFAVLAHEAGGEHRRNRTIAAHLLGEALDQPRGAPGRATPRAQFDQWKLEQLELLELIAALMHDAAPLVRSRLRTAIAWHAAHSAWPEAKAAARRIVDDPEADDEALATAALQPFDFHRDRAHDDVRLGAVATRLIAQPDGVADDLDDLLEEGVQASMDPNPRPLLTSLTARAPKVAERLVGSIFERPDRPLGAHLDTLLAGVARADPARLHALLDRLDEGTVALRRGLAGFLGDIDWNAGDRQTELALLERLVVDEDLPVRHHAMHAVLRIRSADSERAVELALAADLGHEGKLGALMCLTLCEAGVSLTGAQIDSALAKLADIDELEYSTVHFLSEAGAQRPAAVLAMLLDRLGRHPDRGDFEPVPWHPFAFDVLAGADDDEYADLLREVRAAALSSDSHVRHHAPRLFWHLNRDVDLSLGVLHEWLISGDPAKVSAAAHVLTGIAPGRRSSARDEDEGWQELLARPWFVVDVLERTRSEPPELRDGARAGFEAVLFSHEISRTMGEPDERTVLTKQTAEAMLGLLPAGAAARSFFGDLARHCADALEEERLDDEEFPHRLR